MSSNRNRGFTKKKLAQARQEKATNKRSRRAERAAAPRGPDENLDDLVAEVDKPSDAEVLYAIERAMNPGKAARENRDSKGAGNARLFVGNVPHSADERDIRKLFVDQGFDITDAMLPRDRETGDPRGFAFVELRDAAEAEKAIEKLHGFQFYGCELRVNAAEKRR